MFTTRRVARRPRHLLLLAITVAASGACARAMLTGAPGVGTSWGTARACPPAPSFRDPREASYDEVRAYVLARDAEMRGLEPVQGDETALVYRGRATRTRAYAIPAPCAHRESAEQLGAGRLLGMVTSEGDFPLYGLRAGQTAYMWVIRAPGVGMTDSAVVLVNLSESNPRNWRVLSIDYHPERRRFEKAYARFGLIPLDTVTSTSSSDIGRASLFRLASFVAAPAQSDTTGEGNTAAWFSCLAGCCRVRSTIRS